MSTAAPTFTTANSARAEAALKAWLQTDAYLLQELGTAFYGRGPAQSRQTPRLEIEAIETGEDPTIRRGMVQVSATVRLCTSIDDKGATSTTNLWNAVNNALRYKNLAACLTSVSTNFKVWFARVTGDRQGVNARTYEQSVTLFFKCQAYKPA